jgi:hypothetical protein
LKKTRPYAAKFQGFASMLSENVTAGIK